MRNLRIRSVVAGTIVVAACVALGGCASYYKVSEPGGGRVFYTEGKPDRNKNGAVTFKDAKTKADVTLQSSEVSKVSKDEFQSATAKK